MVGGGVIKWYPDLLSQNSDHSPSPSSQTASSSEQQLSSRIVELEKELNEYKTRVSDASKQIAAYESAHSATISAAPHNTRSEESEPSTQHTEADQSPTNPPADAVKWRISAIEKFVPLSGEQKERLAESYRAKSEGRKSETLEEILGNESAQYYREQVSSAFKRMRTQELEKEVVFTSRKLQLSEAQEAKLREIYNSIEATLVAPTIKNDDVTAQERVKRMVEEGKRRSALRAEKTKEVFTPQQYQEYLKSEAESPEADMQVFHDSGE